MPQLAANLTMLFNEVPFMERFQAAGKAGIKSVEFLFPYDFGLENVKKEIKDNGLQLVLFNLPAGDWAGGERGIAADPARVKEFREGVDKAAAWAKELGSPRLNCLAGKKVDTSSLSEQRRTLVENLRYAAETLQKHDIILMVEPINHFDIPGFFLNTVAETLEIIDEVDMPNVYLQFDIYHTQRQEGEITAKLRRHMHQIGHIQIADNPGRHQPGTGEINYRFVLNELDRLGYNGFVSMEYVPQPDTLTSLRWVEEHGFSL